MMPSALPRHVLLVQLSGVCEIVGGLFVLWPRTRVLAGWGLIALLVAVSPANIYSAVDQAAIPMLQGVPPLLLWVRLPVQAVFIAWVYFATIRTTTTAT